MYKRIKKDIYENSKKEYQNLKKYFSEQDFCDKVAIIDIGWNGSMQYALNNIFTDNDIEKADIYGYYVGINKKNKDELNMEGFLFESEDSKLYKEKTYFNSLFELMFSAQHGSTKRYIENGVELCQYEYNAEDENKIVQLQKGALTFIEDIVECKEKIDFNKYISSYNMFRLGINPTLKDVRMFRDIKYLDIDYYKLLNNKNLFYYILHLNEFKEDFRNCVWKTGFLKSMIKLNINYLKIVTWIRNKVKDK